VAICKAYYSRHETGRLKASSIGVAETLSGGENGWHRNVMVKMAKEYGVMRR